VRQGTYFTREDASARDTLLSERFASSFGDIDKLLHPAEKLGISRKRKLPIHSSYL
jgi:hypothetical protein